MGAKMSTRKSVQKWRDAWLCMGYGYVYSFNISETYSHGEEVEVNDACMYGDSLYGPLSV